MSPKEYQSKKKVTESNQFKSLSKALIVTIVLLVLFVIGVFYTGNYLYNRYFGTYHRTAVEYYDKAVDYKEGFEEAVEAVEGVAEDVGEKTKQVKKMMNFALPAGRQEF